MHDVFLLVATRTLLLCISVRDTNASVQISDYVFDAVTELVSPVM